MQQVPFKTEPPTRKPPQRIYIVARDPDSGLSRSVTLYGISPQKFVDAIKSMGESRKPETESSAA